MLHEVVSVRVLTLALLKAQLKKATAQSACVGDKSPADAPSNDVIITKWRADTADAQARDYTHPCDPVASVNNYGLRRSVSPQDLPLACL